MFNRKLYEKIALLEKQLQEANAEISRLMHQRKADAELRAEVERRHEAELAVAASRYGETFSSSKRFSAVHSNPAGPDLTYHEHSKKLLG